MIISSSMIIDIDINITTTSIIMERLGLGHKKGDPESLTPEERVLIRILRIVLMIRSASLSLYIYIYVYVCVYIYIYTYDV